MLSKISKLLPGELSEQNPAQFKKVIVESLFGKYQKESLKKRLNKSNVMPGGTPKGSIRETSEERIFYWNFQMIKSINKWGNQVIITQTVLGKISELPKENPRVMAEIFRI